MKIGDITLDNPFVLGPMAGITDSTFRKICKSCGCALVFSEMVSSKGIYYKDKKTEQLLSFSDEERPIAIQIFGSDPDIMAFAADKLYERKNEILDINMGCPVQKVVKSGDGSALMQNPSLVRKIVNAVVKNAGKPVSVKIRIGWDDKNINVIEIAKIIEDCGASVITIHGRTREQLYSGKANWQYIKEVKNAVQIPVIGSGDVFSGKDAVNMLRETLCDGVMIARGARGNPWIFQEALYEAGIIKGNPEISIGDRINTVIKHLMLLTEEKGEYAAVREMRKHIGWYFKGLPYVSDVRKYINEKNSTLEMIELIEKYREQLINNQ